MANFKLIIEYDGTEYQGWQRQKNAATIQGEIENALKIMTGKDITLIGSGRTDSGVHALGQCANFHCETRLDPQIFQKGLNSLLNKDIVIKDCQYADENFHARYDVKSKTYQYRILNRQIPAAVGRHYAWFIRKKLDTDAMRSAAMHLKGIHDFKAFEGAGSPRSHTVRSVFRTDISEQDAGYVVFEIEADGFLKFMVRNIVGTLAETGLGKISPADFRQILLKKDRKLAAATAPPQGLFLMNVTY
ncbi:MAG: tRNA pseudouridine(38-40) synthase TruA [Desulfobacteraceae bacterium IS3]|nr:MAG: tRNA pseudouridine(38-40) synthase TruA [Desulfobacteraceae bacterium IS3]